MKKYDELVSGREEDFFFLLDAVVNEPHKVPAIVAADRELLRVTNYSGENVLHWLAVENQVEGISLLRSLGSPISSFAFIETVEMGHAETAILLLELGVEVELSYCERALEKNPFNISTKKIRLLKSYLNQFGYKL